MDKFAKGSHANQSEPNRPKPLPGSGAQGRSRNAGHNKRLRQSSANTSPTESIACNYEKAFEHSTEKGCHCFGANIVFKKILRCSNVKGKMCEMTYAFHLKRGARAYYIHDM